MRESGVTNYNPQIVSYLYNISECSYICRFNFMFVSIAMSISAPCALNIMTCRPQYRCMCISCVAEAILVHPMTCPFIQISVYNSMVNISWVASYWNVNKWPCSVNWCMHGFCTCHICDFELNMQALLWLIRWIHLWWHFVHSCMLISCMSYEVPKQVWYRHYFYTIAIASCLRHWAEM